MSYHHRWQRHQPISLFSQKLPPQVWSYPGWRWIPASALYTPTFLFFSSRGKVEPSGGFSAIWFSLFPRSPWDLAPFYLVLIPVVLVVAALLFKQNWNNCFFTYVFLHSSLLMGEREGVKNNSLSWGEVTNFGVSALQIVLNQDKSVTPNSYKDKL